MSYSELKVVNAEGDVVSHSEYRNAHGFAARIWEALCDRYAAKIPAAANYFDRWPALWKAAKDLDLKPCEWNALVSTYDNVIVKSGDLLTLAESYEQFAKEHPAGRSDSHLVSLALALRSIAASGEAPGGICFYAMSVGEDPWSVRERTVAGATPDDDEYEHREYNVNTDTKHWYAELRTLK